MLYFYAFIDERLHVYSLCLCLSTYDASKLNVPCVMPVLLEVRSDDGEVVKRRWNIQSSHRRCSKLASGLECFKQLVKLLVVDNFVGIQHTVFPSCGNVSRRCPCRLVAVRPAEVVHGPSERDTTGACLALWSLSHCAFRTLRSCVAHT